MPTQEIATENLRANVLGGNVSQLDDSFADDSQFVPELDLPIERELAAPERPRGPDGKFTKTETSPESYTHGRAVSRLALDLGFTQEEINQTAPEILEDRVYHVNKRTFEMLAAQRQATGNGIHANTGGAQPAADPEPEAEFDYGMLDEGFAKHLKAMKAELAAVKAELSGQKQARETESRDETIDRVFSEIGDPDLFGEGTRKTLAPTSEEFERRKALVLIANGMGEGPLEQRLKAAHKRLYGTRAAREEEHEDGSYDGPLTRSKNGKVPANLQRERERWDAGTLPAPTHRKPGPLSPDTRAAIAAHRYLQEHDLGDGLKDLDGEP